MNIKSTPPQPIVRDFYSELKNITWKPITYTQYNNIDEDGFIIFLFNMKKERFSIDEFECCSFELSDKEKFLIKVHNKEYLKNVKKLMDEIEHEIGARVYVDYSNGTVKVIKLFNVKFE